jgi:DHA1 family tetracycline resistance protein-like MFS transporter
VQGGLIRWAIPKFGQKKSIFIGLFFYTIGLFFLSIATSSWVLYAALIPYCIGGLSGPSIQGIISNRVPANEQGEIQGVFTSLVSIAAILSPLLMTNLFYYFSNENAPAYFPGAPFLLSSLLCVIAGWVIYVGLRRKGRENLKN